ncbi:large ribosomal subunit protein eL24-like [Apostichopus japonicus]|uniref:large ribosomal subunit protein eL24-like n=1 Tax=Stichopus japonicus TaxID=307972 RepID=UPI003AB8DB02
MSVKTDLCHFSLFKIYPGHGKRYVRQDGKTFIFINSKCQRSFFMKRNPRDINWTVLYRRKHKKGVQEEVTKKRTRKTTKFQRSIAGTSLAEIMAKKNQKPEVRKAQRDQAIKAAKEKNRSKKDTRKPPAKPAQKSQKQKAEKKMKTAAPRVGGKR